MFLLYNYMIVKTTSSQIMTTFLHHSYSYKVDAEFIKNLIHISVKSTSILFLFQLLLLYVILFFCCYYHYIISMIINSFSKIYRNLINNVSKKPEFINVFSFILLYNYICFYSLRSNLIDQSKLYIVQLFKFLYYNHKNSFQCNFFSVSDICHIFMLNIKNIIINRNFKIIVSFNNFKSLLAFNWFFVFIKIAENPSEISFVPYKNYILIFFCLFLLCIISFLYLKQFIMEISYNIFFYVLKIKILRTIILHYCYFIIFIKGIFEKQYTLLVFMFSIPNLLYIYSILSEENSILADPFLWGSFWFFLGLTLIFLDQVVNQIIFFCEKNPTHIFSLEFNLYLKNLNKEIIHDLIYAGFFGRLGKMTAAGQAALFTGAIGFMTGITVSGINVWYNERKDLRQTAKDNADRAAQTEKDNADRAAQTEKDNADRAAKTERKTAKYAENERVRQHEREKWANENKKTKWW